ncbi:hypothetical protein CesoFtcFv8_024340 [Champsocephalus esox]|uniref:Uncharacterized protein n=1 Tax=Champsocephalus esox TaxID=159716 RepID=A0AAN8B682_9TELE|nr:hypothetical protein CesoFtcFv8_024340 [Champsocephalus esox]
MRTSTAPSPPNQHGHSSTFSNRSLNHSQLGLSAQQQKKSEAYSGLRECVSLPQEMSYQSPDAKRPPFPHSIDHDNYDTDTRDTFDRLQVQGPTDHHPESDSTMDVSTFDLKQSPKVSSLPQANKVCRRNLEGNDPLMASSPDSHTLTELSRTLQVSVPSQENSKSPPANPSQLIQQSSSSSLEAAHSRGVEPASSSDSECSSRSESESESTIEEPPPPPVSISVKTELLQLLVLGQPPPLLLLYQPQDSVLAPPTLTLTSYKEKLPKKTQFKGKNGRNLRESNRGGIPLPGRTDVQ